MIVMPWLSPGIHKLRRAAEGRSFSKSFYSFKSTNAKARSSATMAWPSPNEILINAERLVSDAEHLHSQDRCRSAATLIVVALEQMGAFVEALTLETYPDAPIHMGIFGTKANSHAKRQDALAGHVMNFAFSQFMLRVMTEAYVLENGSWSADNFLSWLLQAPLYTLTEKQQREQRQCPDIATANLLMHLTRTNQLKELREYGLYENANRMFSDAEIEQTIKLARQVRSILTRSHVVPEPLQMAGVNMPKNLVFDAAARKMHSK
jgi:hypothetical protein